MPNTLPQPTPTKQADLEIQLCGGFGLKLGGTLAGGLPKQAQLLLARLVLAGSRGISRDHLAEILWPESSSERAKFYLRRTLSQVRTALGPYRTRLVSDPLPTLALDLRECACDWVSFTSYVKRGDWQAAVQSYGGAFLPGQDADWVLTERDSLRELVLKALSEVVEGSESQGDHASALITVRRLLAEDPLREDAWRQLLQILAKQGAYAEMSRQITIARQRFKRELGLPLAAETENLYRKLLEGAQLSIPPASPPQPVAIVRSRIPASLTPLMGREEACQETLSALRSSRLVTLCGVPGVGKTRIAMHVAEQVGDTLGPVLWVELGPTESLTERLAGCVDVASGPGEDLFAAVLAKIGDAPVVLILDGAESQIGTFRGAVGQLLEACRGLRVLAASTIPLQIPGEVVSMVKPLALEAAPDQVLDAPAIRLFIDRLAMPAASLTQQSALIKEICTRLDGLPLALELAAMRARSLSLAEIAKRLDDRFSLLDQGSPVGRHGTLTRALDWSFDLLASEEKDLLLRLTVFPHDWSVAGAKHVGGLPETESTLSSLVESSLIDFEPTGRYLMLESVREYAARKLAARPETHAECESRLVDFLLDVAHEAQIESVAPDVANILALVNRLMERRTANATAHAIRFVNLLFPYWQSTNRSSEALRTSVAVLEQVDDEPTDEVALLLIRAGGFAHAMFNLPLSDSLLQQAGEMSSKVGLQGWEAEMLRCRGELAANRDNFEDAEALLSKARTIFAEGGDRNGEAAALRSLGYVARCRGDLERSEALTEQALKIHTELGDLSGRLWCIGSLGAACLGRGDLRQAAVYFEEARQSHASISNLEGVAWNTTMLADVQLRMGNVDEAIPLLRAALTIHERDLDVRLRAWPLRLLGEALLRGGQLDLAAQNLEEALAMQRANGPSKEVVKILCDLQELSNLRQDPAMAKVYAELAASTRDSLGI